VLEHGAGSVSGHDVVGRSLDIGMLSMGDDEKLSVRVLERKFASAVTSFSPVMSPCVRVCVQMLNFDDIPFDTAIPSRPSGAKKCLLCRRKPCSALKCCVGERQV
jgi:hypothetical protein